ncbi:MULTISPECIES: Ger(x)C family spore germination protein [Paenibacillus]|uniref:Spore gernimation protein GerC n=1 Tax=Paenibacillus taichungensis TaxID=484184 RepID=A0A329QHH0_9BACL|nr:MULTISPECIES: Ger(x)C family spore germination protein [Paenibacillus]RAW11814.1 spore gernimation protein GerC [Paenibacillus taichungensis]
MSSFRRQFTILLTLLLLLFTSGCWSSKEIEDLSVYVGLGLDVADESKFEKSINQQGGHYPKNNNFTATVQIVPRIGPKQENQKNAGASVGQSFLNERLTGDSLFQIFRQFALRRDRPLIGHHLKVIVVSHELTKKYSLEQLLDFILRDNDIRPSSLVLVSHGTALEALSSKEPGEIPAFYLKGVVANSYRSNKILPPVSLAKLDGKMQSGASFLLQNVLTAEGEHKFSGAEIYKGKTKKWIGSLNQIELEGLSWITGEAQEGAVKSYAPPKGHTVTYEIKSSKSKITPKVQGDNISFHVKIESEGQLMEDWSAPEIPSTDEYIQGLEVQFADTVKEQIHQVMGKMQNTYRVEVAGFGEQLRIKYPKVWTKVKKNWDETFSQIPVTYDVKLNIKDSGSSTD